MTEITDAEANIPVAAPLVPAEGRVSSPSAGASDLGEPSRGMAPLGAARRSDAWRGPASHGNAREEDGNDPVLLMIARAASDPAVDVGKFEKLMEMRERLEDRSAKRAFDAAVAAAKGELTPIVKNRAVDFANKAGQRTNYRYEDFAAVAAAVDPALSHHGLSYRFRSEQQGNRLRVTCRVSHADGYGEDTSLEAANDDSGNKNAIQSVGSAATYLQRYTLKLALGLAASNDDDGRLGADDDPLVDADDVLYVETLISETKSDLAKLLAHVGAPSLAEMRASQFKKAIAGLNLKKRQAAAP